MEIDVVMITKNSNRPEFKKSLKSIVREIPLNRLIIVDGGSNDGTIETARSIVGRKLEVIEDIGGTRATARQKGIEAVETEYFAFIDSDVILPPGWFNKILSEMLDDVGGVWGVALPVDRYHYEYLKKIAETKGIDPLELLKRNGEVRGMLHDTLLRTRAVKGIKIPPWLHVMEDHFIRLYVEARGYRWVSTKKAYCYHFLGVRRKYQESYLDALYGWQLGVYPKQWYVKHYALWLLKIVYLGFRTKNALIVRMEAEKELGFLKAFFDILVRGKNLKRIRVVKKQLGE